MSEEDIEEYWAARDSDGWEWIFEGEPTYSNEVWDQDSKLQDMWSRDIAEFACSEVPNGCKRKLSSLDVIKRTVEYEGDAIHG
ncbi:MAG: hypothetical protein E6R03_11385 [Hyphomicrobiaceae bacterium]|nr:MAG: hypothetical protein E6R03_11385 [Hyphomicrobiaceae bacterium]